MAEVLVGKDKNEQFVVSADKTQAYGLSGNDTLISDNKSKVLLIGGSGDDSLIMTGGVGTLNGGKGNDTFEFTYSKDKKISAVIEDLDPASDKIVVNFDGNAAPQLSSVKSGNNVVWKDADGFFKLTLKGVRENDYFDGNASEEVWEVLRRTNNEREGQGLSPLTLAEGLMAGASIRVEEINGLAQTGALNDHIRPNGQSYDTVLENKYNYPGENLDAGARTAGKVMFDWLESPSHYENIMRENFRKLGVGYFYDDSDKTDLRWYWTQMFADSLKAQETVSINELLTENIESQTVSKAVKLTDNTFSNTDYGVTIDGTANSDSITNTGAIVSISSGNSDDKITNSGANVTINVGIGNDNINLENGARENLIQYKTGDGSDTISGFNYTDTLSILDDVEYTPVSVGNDLIVSLGTDSITLKDAVTSGFQIVGTRSNFFMLTDADNVIENTFGNSTINALDGKDYVENHGASVSIDAGADDDEIYNDGENSTINGGKGNDYFINEGITSKINAGDGADIVNNGGKNVSISGGTGNDSIGNFAAQVSIDGGAGNDSITNVGDRVTIDGGTGNDSIGNFAAQVSIDGGAGNDSIVNSTLGNDVSINGGDGDDSIHNDGENVLIEAGDGKNYVINFGSDIYLFGGKNDDIILNHGNHAVMLSGSGDNSIYNSGFNVSVDSGTGNDSIVNSGSNATINSGAGNDTINNSKSKVSIDAGDGDDRINNYNYSLNVTITSGKGNDTIVNSGSNVTIKSDDGNDYIQNSGSGYNVTIDSGAGNDEINNNAANVTINCGLDNDEIVLTGNAKNNVIQYNEGDGHDSIFGFSETSTLQIGGGSGTYSTQTSGDDVIVNVGTGSILLREALRFSYIIKGKLSASSEEGKFITLTETDAADTFRSSLDGATIQAESSKDYLIINYGDNVSINGNVGNDTISNWHPGVTINGGAGDNYIPNAGNNTTITVDDGKDYVENIGTNVTINSGNGNDTIYNWGITSIIDGSLGDDIIYNTEDAINAIIDGGDDDDYITNEAANVTINGGAGDDLIELRSRASNNLIEYRTGDGNDTISGFNETSKLNILDAYSTQTSGDNIIVAVGTDSITLLDAATLSKVNIVSNANATSINGNLITLTELDDNYMNNLEGVTIAALAGNDDIFNYSLAAQVSIDGGAGNDDIYNLSDSVTIDGGEGNDTLYSSGADSKLDGGTGNDTISNSGSEVSIAAGADNDSISNYGTNVSIDADKGNDVISNQEGSSVTINGGDGNDSIHNSDLVFDATIDAGKGNDYIFNSGASVSILGGDGNDTINNSSLASNATIDAGAGDNFISNVDGANISINADDGKDYIRNSGSSATIKSGAGDDTVWNTGINLSINLGEGNDSIINSLGANITVDGDDGDDYIFNGSNDGSFTVNGGDSASINGGAGNDTIYNNRASVTVNGGAGDDFIENFGNNVSIIGGTGNDQISLSSDSKNTFIQYSPGDGNDTVWGLTKNDTLQIGNGKSTYSTEKKGDDVIVHVGTGSITLKNFRDNPKHIIIGESGTSGGGSGGSGGGGASGGGGGGGGSTSGTSGGYSSHSASGSSSSGSTASSSNGGSSGRGNTNTSKTSSSTVKRNTSVSENQTVQNRRESKTFTYAGGRRTVSDYRNGDKILFSAEYTGSYYDGAGNFVVGSSSGSLLVKNAVDKVIDLSNANGIPSIKAYAASNEGVIDGRGIAGFEIINGSNGVDMINAGDGGSSLWGGNGFASDTLVGGAGVDSFVCSKNQGADLILNAAPKDTIYFNDATLSDIVSATENNLAISITFNTGNVVTVRSPEFLSAKFALADGNAYRFNHIARNWQKA